MEVQINDIPQKPIARIQKSQGGRWALENLNCPEMGELDSKGAVKNKIPVGQSVDLSEGVVLRMGPPPKSRLLLTQWIQ